MATTKATSNKSKGHGTSRSDDKGHLYWAKGTGFGTGSTTQSWDVEQHILRQRSEEEHVTCLLLVCIFFMNINKLLFVYFDKTNGNKPVHKSVLILKT